jgi:hypothetical protein
MNSFLSKKYSAKKLISRYNEKTLTRQEYGSNETLCDVKILEQIYVASETIEKKDPDQEKIIQDPQHCYLRVYRTYVRYTTDCTENVPIQSRATKNLGKKSQIRIHNYEKGLFL